MDRNLIEVYVAGGAKLLAAFHGLTKEQLLAYPIPGTWSLQQIAVHMFDSDLIGADRIKRIAAMNKPLLIGYDETAFSAFAGIDSIDAMEACSIVAKVRQFTGILLRALPDEAFDRWGVHNEVGKVTLAEMITKYIHHLDGHLVHVRKKRELLGVPWVD